MMEELCKIFSDNIVFTEEAANIIMNLFVKEKGLNNYLESLNFDYDFKYFDQFNEQIALYSKKNITLYIKSIYKLFDENKKYYPMFDKDELNIFLKVLLVKNILYALEIVNEEKIKNEEDNLEATLLKVSTVVQFLIEGKQIFKDIYFNKPERTKYYDISSSSRIAKIRTLQTIELALKELNSYPNIMDFITTVLAETMLFGYEKDDYPTKMFLSRTRQYSVLEKFTWYDKNINKCLQNVKNDFSYDERILYGLPLDKQDQEALVTKILTSKKYKFQ